ncbi:MAG: enoyl-CoA hydratase-related protein [Chloroflexota bacterium]
MSDQSLHQLESLQCSVDGAIATITINRPENHNAINYEMWSVIPDYCQWLEQNQDIRVIIWKGAGENAFSAGGDISEYRENRNNKENSLHYNDCVATALKAIQQLSKPNIACIKGYCVGGGLILSSHCDLRIAAENARFGIPIAKLGTIVTYEQMQRFMQIMGAAAIHDLLLTARLMDAQEAYTRGLCGQLYPLDEIDEAVMQLATSMTRLSPVSQALHKRMLETLLETPDLAQLTEAQRRLVDDSFDTADYAEGIRAFIEKRSPNFG